MNFRIFWVLGVSLLSLLATTVAEGVAAQDLTLVINPRTGQTTIRNVAGVGVAIDGYLLGSPTGSFNLSGWSSLNDAGVSGWREANPSSGHVSEVNLFSSTTIGAAASLNLGTLYTPFTPTQIGQAEPAVTFEYHVNGGGSVTGDVLFAPQNNLVLVVNPTTGGASIQNQSNFSVAVDGYLISSSNGSLAPTGWTSFIDGGVAGWSEANPAANHLSEVNLLGSRAFAANGAPVSIGTPVNAAVLTDQTDLAFDYHIAGGGTVRGGVAFVLPGSATRPGDFDGDTRVDGNDFLVWQRRLGSTLTAADLVTWRNNFGAGGASAAASPVAQAIPEPAAATLLLGAGLLGAVIQRGRRLPV